MDKPIAVIDETNHEIGRTFNRRARQLVSSSRAVWLDETHTAIRLITPGLKEEINMDSRSVINETQQNNGYTIADKHVTDGLYDKDSLLKLAKKKVHEKRKLKQHILIYFTLGFIFLLIAASMYDDFFWGFYLGCILVAGIYLVNHIAEYFSPYMKNGGILKFFINSYRDPVEAEYKKLKRMEPERIAAEFKRL